jgi:Right handed beta helix region/Matrixin
MVFPYFLRSLNFNNFRWSASRMRRRSRRRKERSAKPVLEVLEVRTVLSPYMVTTTADWNPQDPSLPPEYAIVGSLRDAINQINADTNHTYASPTDPTKDEIDFKICTTDPGYHSTTQSFTIAPLTALPLIENSVIINGYSQPGAVPNTLAGVGPLRSPNPGEGDNAILKIELDGELQPADNQFNVRDLPGSGVNGVGLALLGLGAGGAGNSLVEGLVINRFAIAGIVTTGGNTIQGNFIGTDVTGEIALGNGAAGVYVGINGGDLIGGTTAAARNIISATTGSPLGLNDSRLSGNAIAGWDGDKIEGNFIGTDATGTKPLGNVVGVRAGDSDVVAGNLIDASTAFGINAGTGVTVQGNFMGTDVMGTTIANPGPDGNLGSADDLPLGNTVAINIGPGGTIGGIITGQGNLISGNDGGIALSNSKNLVQGNFIGTDVTGKFSLGNHTGISFFGGPDNTGGSNNTIGGTTLEARNVISGNNGALFFNGGSNNLIQGNLIGTEVTGTTVLGPGWREGGLNPGFVLRPPVPVTIRTTDGGTSILSGTGEAVDLEPGCDNNTIGGTVSGAGNVIGYNQAIGVLVRDDTTANQVTGNTIHDTLSEGINIAGTRNAIANNTVAFDGAGIVLGGNGNQANANAVYGNFGDGVALSGTANTLGANVIHDNGGRGGVELVGTGNTIAFNAIYSNVLDGVYNVGTGNTIGNNAIYGNGEYGVWIRNGTGNTIISNSIHDNALLGIQLNPDVSANNNQAAPVLTGLAGSAASPAISGILTSVVNTTFRIEFFANPSPTNLSNTEGQTLLGSVYVTTDGIGKASFKAPGLAAIPTTQGFLTATATVATAATSGYTYGDTSQFSAYLHVLYFFGGFQAPLSQGLSFAVNRVVPIRFQLTDLSGAAVATLSAVSSLQVAPVNTDGSLGTPFNPASAGNNGLRLDGSTFAFDWQTKGLAVGKYEILLKLADGTIQTKALTLTANGNGANAQAVDGSDVSGGTAGQLLGGNLEVYVNDPASLFTPDEFARIQDAVNAADALVERYGVSVAETSDPTLANVVIDTGSTSAVGGYAQGILGCYDPSGEITLIQGWNWYDGADPTQIGTGQYDFQTVVTHELGHALGLGGSADPTSLMDETLAVGVVRRSPTVADLNIPEPPEGADPERAAGAPAGPTLSRNPVAAASAFEFRTGLDGGTSVLSANGTGRPSVSQNLALVGLPGQGLASRPLASGLTYGGTADQGELAQEFRWDDWDLGSPPALPGGSNTFVAGDAAPHEKTKVPPAAIEALFGSEGAKPRPFPVPAEDSRPAIEVPSAAEPTASATNLATIEQAIDVVLAGTEAAREQPLPAGGRVSTSAAAAVFTARASAELLPLRTTDRDPQCEAAPTAAVDAGWAWAAILGFLVHAEVRGRGPAGTRDRIALMC